MAGGMGREDDKRLAAERVRRKIAKADADKYEKDASVRAFVSEVKPRQAEEAGAVVTLAALVKLGLLKPLRTPGGSIVIEAFLNMDNLELIRQEVAGKMPLSDRLFGGMIVGLLKNINLNVQMNNASFRNRGEITLTDPHGLFNICKHYDIDCSSLEAATDALSGPLSRVGPPPVPGHRAGDDSHPRTPPMRDGGRGLEK